MKEQRNPSIGRWPLFALAGLAGLAGVLAPGVVASSLAAVTPSFRNTNVSGPSVLVMTHDVDSTTGAPAETGGPYGGLIPGPAALLAPFAGAGDTIVVAGGSSLAKGGAGHTEGSNLGKITFPSGTGVDQTDPNPHDVGPSTFTEAFNFRWLLPTGTFGPTNGTFSVPVGAKVGTGAGAFAKFEYDIHWAKEVNGVFTDNIRPAFTGSVTFPSAPYPGPGPWLINVTAPTATIGSITAAGSNDFIIMHGSIRFISNNDDGVSVIELVGGPDLGPEINPELRNNPQFLNLWNNQVNDEFRYLSNTGFEPFDVPEPSGAIVVGALGGAGLLMRRRREPVVA